MKKLLQFLFLFLATFSVGQTVTEATQELPNVFQSTNQFLIGVDLGPVTFANLPTSSDGRLIYCSNCQQVTPCVGGGTGALASRTNGAWSCSLGSGGGGGTTAEFLVNGIDTSSQTVINFQNGNGVTWSNPSAGNIQASISGVIVNPVASQNIVQPTGTSFSSNNIANTRYVTSSWAWSQSPAADLSAAGSKTITLTPCPLGIDVSNNTNSPYFVYIATQGTPETALVTGGSCTSGGTTGTIIVTTVNTHSAGYTVASATSGIQEAINDAGSPNATVIVPPSTGSSPTYFIRSTLYLKSNKMTLSSYGAHFSCLTRGPCVYVSDRASGTQYHKVLGGRFAAGINIDGIQITNTSAASGTYTITTNGSHPFVTGDYVSVEWYQANGTQRAVVPVTVTGATTFTYLIGSSTVTSAASFGWAALNTTVFEDNSQGAVFRDINFTSVGSPNKFNYGIVVDNDQSAVIDHINNEGSGNVFRCTSNFCGAMIYARGDQGSASVVWLKDSELSLQCGGNGILAAGGNSFHVSDTVIQGFNQYGFVYPGGLQGALITNVYEEVGSCLNPNYPGSIQSAAGALGNRITIKGDSPISGITPVFANTGANQRNYFIVPKSTGFGPGPIMLAGYATTNNAGTVNVYWPQVVGDNAAGTITYDVLLVTGSNSVSPYTGSANSLTLASSGSCSNGVCTFADTHAATSAYTVSAQTWYPHLYFWPGGYVGTDSTNRDASFGTETQFSADFIRTNFTSGYVSSLGNKIPSAITDYCLFAQSSFSPAWVICRNTGTASAPTASAGIFQEVGGSNVGTAGLKGKLNFASSSYYPSHFITWSDSNLAKTLATAMGRPAADANDSYTGQDQAGGLAMGAQTSISMYTGNIGDNSAFAERVTATAKQINRTTTINDGTGATRFKGTYGTCAVTGDVNFSAICYDAAGDLVYNKKNATNYRKVIPQDYTVATLPSSAIDTAQLAVVTDASNATCPLTGGGTTRVLVRYSGAAWECVSGGGTTIGTYTFATLPVAPSTGTPAMVSDFTGTCPVTTGSGSPGKYILVRYNGSGWDCVTPTDKIPFNFTSQSWDGTQALGSTGGYHFGSPTSAITNTNGDTNVMFLLQGAAFGGATSQIAFWDTTPALWYTASYSSGLTLPTGSNKKCTGIDLNGHLQFYAGECLADPTSVNGDIIIRSGGALNRLPIGTNGQVLTVVSSLPAWGTALTNPMTNLGDALVGGSAGAATRLAGPVATNGVPQYFTSTPAAGVATAEAWSTLAIPTNAQTGTTYTVAATDREGYVSLSNAAAIAVTLPQAGTTGFANNFYVEFCAIGAGTATITPTTSTISYSTGSSYVSAAANMPLTTGQCAWVRSNNTNYFAILRGGTSPLGTSDVLAQSASQTTVTVATSPAVGLYLFKYYADLNTACTTGGNSVSFTFNWSDATGARSLSTGNLSLAQGSPTSSSFMSGSLPIWIGSSNFTYTSTVSGACSSGTSSYDIHVNLVKG